MKMQTLAKALLLPVLMVAAIHTHAQEKVNGNGQVKKETRSITGTLQEISLSGTYKLYITQGNTPSVEIEAEENLLPYIVTETDDNELNIQGKKGFNVRPTKDIIIRITTPDLREISSSGNSSIYSTNALKGDKLELSLSGNSAVQMNVNYNKLELAVSGDGKIQLKGSAGKTEFAISGDGNIAATDMKSEDMEVAISGKGVAHVNASRKLEISISGQGTVKYKGNPTSMEQSISGKGVIEKL